MNFAESLGYFALKNTVQMWSKSEGGESSQNEPIMRKVFTK